jgi:hypothetical protein
MLSFPFIVCRGVCFLAYIADPLAIYNTRSGKVHAL